MHVDWHGVMPALLTQMKEDGALDLDGTAAHVRCCLEAGIDGLVMLGTLGENTSLSSQEKIEVLRCAIDAAGSRVPILAGVAEYTTRQAIEFASRAERTGASGLMVLPCMVYEQDQREAIAHFQAVARSTQLPVMIYNNPVSYRTDLTPDSFARLVECENILAVKESSHDSRRITEMINRLEYRFLLFCGVDDLALENLLCGAAGWVSGLANAFPDEAVELYRLARAGQLAPALELYRWFMPMLRLDTHSKLVQNIKLANHVVGQGSEWVRAPRLTLEGEERARVEAIVRRAIHTRPARAGLAA